MNKKSGLAPRDSGRKGLLGLRDQVSFRGLGAAMYSDAVAQLAVQEVLAFRA